ncbi:MAG: FAD-dependent oxidoreductase [Calditerrivibrio sp.]|nr:FAD-dependent oxidoreductase [Calditerrivibrio sp.]
MALKVVVIGGVAAGATVAAKVRRMDENAEITLIEKNGYISFANCGMPYYIGDIIRSRNSLLFHNEKSFKKRFNVDVHTKTEVFKIDPVNKVVYAKKNNNDLVQFSYDKLAICNGAKTFLPPIKGLNAINYWTLRSIEDMDGIKQFIVENKPTSAAIIGGGYIGIETAEALHNCGLKVSIVEALPNILPTFSPEISQKIYDAMISSNIEILCKTKVVEVSPEGDKTKIITENGKEIYVDMLIVSTGVKPDTSIAETAGIKIGELGGVEVNEFMETSIKDIYAAGDLVEKVDLVTGKKILAPLAGPANREGRVAGSNIAGFKKHYKGTLRTAIVSFGKACCAQTGISYEEAIRSGYDAGVIYTEDPNHVEYYPGARYIFLKLIYDKKSGRILGAQASGEEGVERRIDIIASAIYGKLTVYDLEDIDFCYSPPFGAAKDPVNIAGYVASNILRNEAISVTPEQFLELFEQKDIQILDVRTRIEFKSYRVKGAINIYLNDLRESLEQIRRDLPVYIYCAVGYRGYIASKMLNNLGFKAYNVLGGIEAIRRFAKIKLKEVIDGSNS